jgi:hypothetical protein
MKVKKKKKKKKKKNSVHRECVLWDWVSHKKQIKFSDLYLANNSEFRGVTLNLRRALERLVSFAKKYIKADLYFSSIRNSNFSVSKISEH